MPGVTPALYRVGVGGGFNGNDPVAPPLWYITDMDALSPQQLGFHQAGAIKPWTLPLIDTSTTDHPPLPKKTWLSRNKLGGGYWLATEIILNSFLGVPPPNSHICPKSPPGLLWVLQSLSFNSTKHLIYFISPTRTAVCLNRVCQPPAPFRAIYWQAVLGRCGREPPFSIYPTGKRPKSGLSQGPCAAFRRLNPLLIHPTTLILNGLSVKLIRSPADFINLWLCS